VVVERVSAALVDLPKLWARCSRTIRLGEDDIDVRTVERPDEGNLMNVGVEEAADWSFPDPRSAGEGWRRCMCNMSVSLPWETPGASRLRAMGCAEKRVTERDKGKGELNVDEREWYLV
jgi:hypothetical protein